MNSDKQLVKTTRNNTENIKQMMKTTKHNANDKQMMETAKS